MPRRGKNSFAGTDIFCGRVRRTTAVGSCHFACPLLNIGGVRDTERHVEIREEEAAFVVVFARWEALLF